MRLGRLQHDPQRLAAAPSLASHRFAATPPASFVDRSAVAFEPQAWGNIELPNCTAAGLANAIGMVGALNGWQPAIEPSLVPRFYGACIGQPNATDEELAATDGAVVIDVLQYQVAHGFDYKMLPPDAPREPMVGLWGTLPNATAIAQAIDKLGHAYLGVTLRERDMQMPAVWDFQPGRDDGKPVGGHCIVAWDYAGLADDATIRIATWGEFQETTWGWLQARLDEAHALVWRQLAAASGVDLGVDVAMLQADLAAFSA
jgi:hypothetical protein